MTMPCPTHPRSRATADLPHTLTLAEDRILRVVADDGDDVHSDQIRAWLYPWLTEDDVHHALVNLEANGYIETRLTLPTPRTAVFHPRRVLLTEKGYLRILNHLPKRSPATVTTLSVIAAGLCIVFLHSLMSDKGNYLAAGLSMIVAAIAVTVWRVVRAMLRHR